MDFLAKAKELAEQGMKAAGEAVKHVKESDALAVASERAKAAVVKLQDLVGNDDEAVAILHAIVLANRAIQVAPHSGANLDMAQASLKDALNRAAAWADKNPVGKHAERPSKRIT